MSCCGQGRAALRHAAASASTPKPVVTPTPSNPVRLAYRGEGPTVVRGARTGLTYLFGPRDRTLEVDASDADALLATQRFERR